MEDGGLNRQSVCAGGERINVVPVLFTFRAEETKYRREYDQT